MKKRYIFFIWVSAIFLWVFLAWVYFHFYQYDRFFLTYRDYQRGWIEVSYYNYPVFNSAKIVTSDFIFYINPPFYYKYASYYKVPFSMRKLKRIVLFTNGELIDFRKVRETLLQENVSEVYLPYFYKRGEAWDDLMEIIVKKKIYFRYYCFPFKKTFGKIKVIFFSPSKGKRSRSGAFLFQFPHRKKLFFSHQFSATSARELAQLLKGIKDIDFFLLSLENREIFPSRAYLVYQDFTSFKHPKIDTYLSLWKTGKPVYRINDYPTGIKLFISPQGKEKIFAF